MRKYLDLLFISHIDVNEELLSNSLFISFDKSSALRGDYKKVLALLKKYSNYEITKENIRALHEGYSQGLFIIKLDNKDYFLRLIIADGQIYDVLVYTIKDIDFINRVFFSQKIIEIPSSFLDKLSNDRIVIILNKENADFRILKANEKFYNAIKYEDWDFANKYQNILNQRAVDSIDLNSLRLYRSDGKEITIACEYEQKGSIYCLMEK